jgi:hypothetical protein
MGGGISMRVIDPDGVEKFVRLTGAEKAILYRALANLGIYERDVPEDMLPIEEQSARGLEERPGDEPPERFYHASTMHCCEAAEIVFEDIS